MEQTLKEIEEAKKTIKEKAEKIKYEPEVRFEDVPIPASLKVSSELSDKMELLSLRENIEDALRSWLLEIDAKNTFCGSKGKAKKAVYKLNRFYTDQLILQESEFNANVVVAVSKLYEEFMEQKKIIKEQEEKIARLEERLNDIK